MPTVDLTRTEPTRRIVRNTVRCAHNPGIGKKEARVHSEYAAFAMKPAIPRANAHRKVSAYATRATTVHISSEIALATKCANVARNTGTMRRAVRNDDAKRAAAQRTKARLASSALNTSARNAKARSIRKGTIETIALYRSPLFARSARKSDTKRIDAQRDRVLHVAFERTDYRHIKRPEHICTTCKEKGHNRSNCPTTQCDTCGTFGHLPNDCPFASCVDVEVDWLNILLSTQSLQTIDSYFEDVSLPPTALRIDGIMRKFDDWEHIQRVCLLVSSENLLEIKRASHTFKRDANREYDRRMRELNKLTQSPINFAFTADYTDDSVPKCPFCCTYLFPQETSKKMSPSSLPPVQTRLQVRAQAHRFVAPTPQSHDAS